MGSDFKFYFFILFGRIMSEDSCSFKINNRTEKKYEFQQLLNSGIKMVYVDIFISNHEWNTNNTKYDIKQESGLLRWIWTKNEISFLLSYTEDIHALSFNLLKGAYFEDFTINIEMSPPECVSVYKNDTKSLFYLIHDSFVQNESDWLLCHRYFENQEWKVTLFKLTAYWLGYGMECFQRSCRKKMSMCESYIEKSVINYLIVSILIVFFLFSPIFIYFFPEKVHIKNIKSRLNNYNPSDTPYSFYRLLLNMNKQPFTFPKKRMQSFVSYLFSQESQVLTILVIICTIINATSGYVSTMLIQYFTNYKHLYLLDTQINLYFRNSIKEQIFYFFVIGLFILIISLQIIFLRNTKNVYFIYFLWTKTIVKYVDIDKVIGFVEQIGYDPQGYKIFVAAILNRMALLFFK